MTDPRLPRSVYRSGDEPDPRFSLANERTFLAWIRTALAFLAGAVALEALATPLHPPLRLAAALILVATAIALVVEAWVGWTRTERAMRHGRPLPPPVSALPAAVGLLAAAVLVAMGLVLGTPA
ncbi:YidH family protein [Isoptericola aurantiacus]|uniref:YidH family protein n=1 Tax=Isoptericola aurantiacus TaxID=3377839 RepID=UPI00383A9AEC